jgi:type IV pilus assembly protein PilM
VSAAPSLPRAGAQGLAWARRQFLDPERPLVAVEVRASTVGVLRLRREKGHLLVGAAAVVDLAPGTLAPSLTQPNIADLKHFAQALHGALERAGILGGARIALVLPDTAARVTLVPAVEVPSRKPRDVDELLRFRLRKSIPFDVREARIAYAVAGDTAADTIAVAAALGPVVAQYEEACRGLGLEPGLVEIAGLALVRAAFPAGASGDGLLVNWDDGYVTLVLARNGWPILLRTLSGASATAAADVVREVSSTLIYYRERLGGSGIASAFVRSSQLAPEAAVLALAPVIGFEPAVFDAWSGLGGAPAEVAQVLAGAAASLGARP